MSAIDFIRSSMRRMHGEYTQSIADLDPDQLHWRANERGCGIAFILWHYVRTEDNIIQFVLQRRPTIWREGAWDDKFGLPRNAQGTGMSLQDAQTHRIDSLDDFRTYMRDVFQTTEAFLADKEDPYLQQLTTVKPLGEIPILNAIGQMCLAHGLTHLGEIQHLRGLMGLQGMSF
jgi:hypothetical protein